MNRLKGIKSDMETLTQATAEASGQGTLTQDSVIAEAHSSAFREASSPEPPR